MARRIETLSEREFVQQRLHIWLGGDDAMRSTIVVKELIDNEIDVINDPKQSATEAVINIGPNRIKAMDNGAGISTEIGEGHDQTDLFLAVNKLYSSSNYEGVKETVGSNGVGLTVANFTSSQCTIMNFNGPDVRGYQFKNGVLVGSEEDPEIYRGTVTGDKVSNPESKEVADKLYGPDFKDGGFLVDIIWEPAPNDMFVASMNIDWLKNYTKLRIGEIGHNGKLTFRVYADDEFTTLVSENVWTSNKKPETDEEYVPSWYERVKEAGGRIVDTGNWRMAFFIKDDIKIDSFVQGAPVVSRHVINQSFDIQKERITVKLCFSMYFVSDAPPRYTDQSKVAVTPPYAEIAAAFERSAEVYQHFYREAEKLYMVKVILDSGSNTYWPALGPAEEAELIIAEGYSPITAIKSQRDTRTQACIALRGKFLNTWGMDMPKAMNSDVVRQILNAVMTNKYKQILLAVDADEHGSHIASLLLALFARYTNVIQEGRVKYVHTPHYIFKKTGQPIQWSDDARDCPPGFHVTTLKGLGGLSSNEIKAFVTDPTTRDLIDIEWGEEIDAVEALDEAFNRGGKSWILEK